MNGTWAVPLDLAQAFGPRPMCPACNHGRLHPYRITVPLGGFDGRDTAVGWVAVCSKPQPIGDGTRGDEFFGEYEKDRPTSGCGFSMALTPGPTRSEDRQR
ncbi:MAG: hypothetical protein ACRD0W_00900 [Acidimicrobiales bacterium]